MALETEVKIRVSKEDFESIRARLQKLQARLLSPRLKEENLLFDFPDNRLRESGCALRLRTCGKHALLTFKGKLQEDPTFKKREELETNVADPRAARQILESLGMTLKFEYSKFRESYELFRDDQRIEVCLDETAAGTFVEIEGADQSIRKLAEQFGWSPGQFIRKNYVELFMEASGR